MTMAIALEPTRLCRSCYNWHRAGQCDKTNRRHFDDTTLGHGFCGDQRCESHETPPDKRRVGLVGICTPEID